MFVKKGVFVMMVVSIAASTVPAALEYSAGTGDNEAFLTIDFGFEVFNFSYKWEGSGPVSGWTVLDEIAGAGALEVDATWYPSFGAHLINDLNYGAASKYDGGTSWGYYTSTDGSVWTSSPVGVDIRLLSDGDWDGWSWGPLDSSWNHLRAPGEPVPEPVSVILLATGGLLARAATRRR